MANIIQTFPKGNGTDLSIIAEEFDSTKDYKVGDKVIKDKKYYIFTSDHDAGAWDSSDVDETNVSEEIPIGLTDEDMDEIKAQFHPVGYGNVRLYHIYSPNEQVVGEWQEEISGVLKKKPLYEKTIKSPSVETILISNVEELVDFRLVRQSTEASSYYMIYTPGFGGSVGDSTVYPIIENNNLRIGRWGSAASYGNIHFVYIVYTKTTDSWEEV